MSRNFDDDANFMMAVAKDVERHGSYGNAASVGVNFKGGNKVKDMFAFEKRRAGKTRCWDRHRDDGASIHHVHG